MAPRPREHQRDQQREHELDKELPRTKTKQQQAKEQQRQTLVIVPREESELQCKAAAAANPKVLEEAKNEMNRSAEFVPGYTDFGSRVWHVYVCRLLGRLDCPVPHCPRYRPSEHQPSSRSKPQQQQQQQQKKQVREIEAETGSALPMPPGYEAVATMCRVLHALVCRRIDCRKTYCARYRRSIGHVVRRRCPADDEADNDEEPKSCECRTVAAFMRHWDGCRERDCAYCRPIKEARDAHLRERRRVSLSRARRCDFRRQMLLLLHAQRCQGDCQSAARAALNGQWPPCRVPQCAAMGRVCAHARHCRINDDNDDDDDDDDDDESCPEPHCRHVKALARHWIACALKTPVPRCASCRSVRRTHDSWLEGERRPERERNFGAAMTRQRLMLLSHALDCPRRDRGGGDDERQSGRECSVRSCKPYSARILRHVCECLGRQHQEDGPCGEAHCAFNTELLKHYLGCRLEEDRWCRLCGPVLDAARDRALEASPSNFRQMSSSRHAHFYLFEIERFLKQQREKAASADAR
ncbi:hypothetical protein TKK_0016429 [Trichogramma kaykai]|uniref:TAZ-type domain-containing protein n=1 Tax=Trichogramma kaykai TaxID=54128 RepID=A0ABD2W6D0_9HYME